jgi:hypothetical protein
MFTKASLILMVTLIIFVMLVHIEASVAGRFFENFGNHSGGGKILPNFSLYLNDSIRRGSL